ncbi:hypothetical protein BX666DRAFT_1855352 [Dichotomocladium elegans]|nr:hypothetical protein BX666DRAFT_1855352 [Dichotomocladium elegans]
MLDTLIILLTYVSNLLKGDRRSINTNNPNVKAKMGLDDSSKCIIAEIGYNFNTETEYFDAPEYVDEDRLFVIRAQLLLCLHTLQQGIQRSIPSFAAELDGIRIAMHDLHSITGVNDAVEHVSCTNEPGEQDIGDYLGSTAGATDDLLIWLYRRLVQEEPEKASAYMGTLARLAHLRESETLLTEVAIESSTGRVSDTDISDAFSYYGLSQNDDVDEEYLKNLFEQKMKEDPGNEQTHRVQLEIIANLRKNDKLRTFAGSGKGPGMKKCIKRLRSSLDLPTRPDKPIGLNNIGNTCYLNSLLQYYYTLVPLRETILHLDENADNEEDPDWTIKKIGGMEVDRKEVKRAKKFVSNLRDLFINLGSTTEWAISPTYDLAYMALLNGKEFEEIEESNNSSTAVSAPSKVEKSVNRPEDPSGDPEHEDPPAYDEAVRTKNPVTIEDKKSKPVRRPSAATMMLGKQQDCMSNVMYLVEAALRPLERKGDEQTRDIVRDLFYFKARQILTYEDTSTLQVVRKVQQEEFAHVIVDAVEGKELYDGLDEYFFAGRVENFHGGRDATREVTVSAFPPVLQIQVQRVQFDRETSNIYKSNAFVKLEKTLYLDRYSEENFEALAGRRREVAEWQRQLNHHKAIIRQLTEDKAYPMPIPQMLEATAEILAQHCRKNNEEQTVAYKEAIQLLISRADQARSKIAESISLIKDLQQKIRAQYDDLTCYEYKLHAVFIHKGQANYGHYWVYIYDHKAEQWWRYNDSYVSKVVEEAEIFLDTTGHTANPYFVVYVRVADIDEIVETKSDNESGP